ncbi:MAG TPA: single-stranded DNA-binding protein [Solirubrobacteraceae bacterium]|jgi:single-strand DNA-binding protein|nr:single-stranded DNA-binding protein [Solirubrobacteraceae bacterium]
MSYSSINRVTLIGNLTAEPELRSLSSGSAICKLRLACTSRRKNSSGEWVNRPNYFDVDVWGNQAESCRRFLAKGRPVAVDGHLEWNEWETKEGHKRHDVTVVADRVQFLGPPPAREERAPEPEQEREQEPEPEGELVGVAGETEREGDDLPF